MTAASPSFALPDKMMHFQPSGKADIQHKKGSPAHHIVGGSGKRKNDFSNLNR